MKTTEGKTDRDKILTKMGRNLLLFQRTEAIPKGLAEMGCLGVSSRDSKLSMRSSPVSHQAFGQIINWFAERQYGEYEVINDPMPGWVNISFRCWVSFVLLNDEGRSRFRLLR